MSQTITPQKGMILLTTLLLISVMSLLILSQLESVFLYYQASNRFIAKQQLFHQIEAQANKLVLAKVWAKKGCEQEKTDPQTIAALLKNKRGCFLTNKNQSFFYLVEDLGLFPCLQSHLDSQNKRTHHWRLSLLAAGERAAFLQLRIAQPDSSSPCDRLQLIKPKVISWRYLSST